MEIRKQIRRGDISNCLLKHLDGALPAAYGLQVLCVPKDSKLVEASVLLLLPFQIKGHGTAPISKTVSVGEYTEGFNG
jgi:hypothetical protein